MFATYYNFKLGNRKIYNYYEIKPFFFKTIKLLN